MEPTQSNPQLSHAPAVTGRPDPGDRLATWLRRLRWPVVIAWVLAIVALNPIAGSLSSVTNDTASAYLPSSAPSTRVVDLQQSEEGRGGGRGGHPGVDPAIVVFARGNGLTATDLAAVVSARAAVAGLAGKVTGLAAPGPLQRSADAKAVLFVAEVTSPAAEETADDTAAVQAIRRVVAAPASRAGDGLQVAVTGSAAVNADSGVGSKTLTTLRLTALAIIVVILLLVYRRPLLWLLPVLGVIGAIVVAEAGARGLVGAGLTVSSLSAAILIVLVLGAASDYALLLIHRYRDELRHHAATQDAMAAALRATVPTLVASAATVVCAMLCLLAAQSASLHGLGLSARIREESRQLDLRRGTLRGLAVTGGVITAAGIILGATFADLARLPNVPVAEVGIAVALGVLLDTLLVRTVLVPASMLTIGERVWWPARSPLSGQRHLPAPAPPHTSAADRERG
jgi:putative drug exporter of the RND superfamily